MAKKKADKENNTKQLGLFEFTNTKRLIERTSEIKQPEQQEANQIDIDAMHRTHESSEVAPQNVLRSDQQNLDLTSSTTHHVELTENENVMQLLWTWSIDTLVEQIKYHDHLYDMGQPVIQDTTYDQITERLRQLDPKNPILNKTFENTSETDDEVISLNSDIKRAHIGKTGSQKVIHDIPMLSLGKAYSAKEVLDWAKNIQGDLVASPKLDGLACSLRYDEKGDLIIASTRGNGDAGDDITANVRYISAIPKHIAASNVEIRGEVYMPLSSFRRFEDAKSPRNLAVGGLKQKVPSETAKYGLSFFGYEMFGESFTTEKEKLNRIQELGFCAVEHEVLPRNTLKLCALTEKERVIAEEKLISDYTQRMLEERATWDFDADGLVFKTNDISEQDLNNVTLHHPKYAIAFKFQGESGTTVLRSVEWQVAKQGLITPVGNFDAIILNGAAIKRANLIHAGHIEYFPDPTLPRDPENPFKIPTYALKLGAKILVSRRGGVIPCIERAVDIPEDAQTIEIPTKCPSCGAPVQIIKSDKSDPVDAKKDYVSSNSIYFIACSDPTNCPSTSQSIIENYVKVINCLGFGEKIIDSLYEADLITTPADLYRLSVKDIAFAISQTKGTEFSSNDTENGIMPQKLYDAIQLSRTMSLAQFLEALSIPNLGKEMSRELESAFGSIDKIIDVDSKQLIGAIYIKNKNKYLYSKIQSSIKAYDETTRNWLLRVGVKEPDNRRIRNYFKDDYHAITAASLEEIFEALVVEIIKEEPKKFESIHRGLIARRPLIEDLLQYVNVTVSQKRESPKDGPFKGMSFLFTGSLASMKREEAQKKVEALGGSSANSVTKTLSVLVATNNTSSKWKKAEELNAKGTANIELWTEALFLERLKEAETISATKDNYEG